ncbi:nucleolar protein 3 [Erinaceus europaeus]|uniref:Nucleolar protein 3 n=1 Tax=Erinaceus europaeus TaxID=9365 RepID=A0A1S2ZDS9_ERIEU|nr:nucleolar protein 3 [Erinaceus europaeus]XP_016041349.1 nucleolar protein 3 [Erinaceus europaeus]
MGNAQERPSETIDRERKRLVESLQADSGLLLDTLLARGVLTQPEYEELDALPDAERRVRRLLLLVQSKGEASSQELLRCAQQMVRAPDPTWEWQHVGTGYRERTYDPPCPSHCVPEECTPVIICSDSSQTEDPESSPNQEKPESELEAEVSERTKRELELQLEEELMAELELEAEQELETKSKPEPELEPDEDS